jgi:hypothetical protein
MDRIEFIQRFIIQHATDEKFDELNGQNTLICRAMDWWDLIEDRIEKPVVDPTNLWDYNDK